MPILTTHAGSLPRPPELDRAWALRSRGEAVDPSWLDEQVTAATTAVVAHQADIGIDIAGNGEQGRESFFTHVLDRFAGFGGRGDPRPFRDIHDFPDYHAQRLPRMTDPAAVSISERAAAIEEVRYLGTAAIDAEVALLRQLAGPRDFADLFVTAPSPGIVATAMTNRYYPTIEDYVDALAAGLAHEYRAVVQAGFLLQVDAPDLALERHVLYADRPLDEFVAFAGCVVAAINRAIAGLPRDRVRLHICWGNYDGPHCYDVPLEAMLDTYAAADAGTLVLSLANPRHAHEYRLLSRLPDHVGVVVGCIDTTSNYVEHPQVVADRLARAVDAIGDPARIQAGTDCGFATAAGPRDVARDVVWLKLRALVEGAALAGDVLGVD